MSKEQKGQALEDYGATPVPAERSGAAGSPWGSSSGGWPICIPAFMVGGMMGSMVGLGGAIGAALLGALILTVLSILTGIVGAHTRVSTAMSTQFAFGRYGNIIFAILLFIGTFGWFGVQLEMFAQAVNGAVQAMSGSALPRWLPILAGGILMSITALIGFKAIEWLSTIVIPILLVLMVVTLVLAFRGHSLAEVFAKAPAQPVPFGLVVSIVAGAFAIGAVIQPDITRYAKGKGHAAGGMIFGMGIGFPLVLILAAFLGAASGQSDFADDHAGLPQGGLGLLRHVRDRVRHLDHQRQQPVLRRPARSTPSSARCPSGCSRPSAGPWARSWPWPALSGSS